MVNDSFYESAGGKFRLFVNNMYYAAMKERDRYKQAECSQQEYWDANKYWLKNRFQETGGNIIDTDN